MKLYIWGVVIVQFLAITDSSSEVNNIVKSKILFSNQELIEKNTEIVHKTEKTIMSRNEIFEFLKQNISKKDESRLKDLLDLMGPKELRHIDFLIYLMHYYNTASSVLLQSILEILKEDETNFKALMRNFQ